MLDPGTIAAITETLPSIHAQSLAIVHSAYRRLLRDPRLRAALDPDDPHAGMQSASLAQALIAYAHSLNSPSDFLPTARYVASRYPNLDLDPDQRAAIADAIIESIHDHLDAAAVPAAPAAWAVAIRALSAMFTETAARTNAQTSAPPSEWTGFRRFELKLSLPECATMTSFYLAPTDGARLPPFRPGQFLTLKLDVPGHGPVISRYPLSSGAVQSDYYRISFEQAGETDDGRTEHHAARYLQQHANDTIVLDVAAPAGPFTLPRGQQPLILIAGDMGIAPLLSMLETVAVTQPNRPVRLIHTVRNRSEHAFGLEVRHFVQKLTDGQAYIFYETVDSAATLGRDYDFVGSADPAWIVQTCDMPEARYAVCGPSGFLQTMIQGLMTHAIAAERISYGSFGANQIAPRASATEAAE